MKLIGRTYETSILKEALTSSKPELVAVIGRRRVGKTFMIRKFFEKELLLEFVGIYGGTQEEHLNRFAKLEKSFIKSKSKLENYLPPKDWFELFDRVEALITKSRLQSKKVIFLDELPWMASNNPRFLKALGHFWNAWASKRNDIVLVVSGSSTSWMLNKIFKNKGGLYNRTTRKIILKPFSLHETEQFLEAKDILVERNQVLEYQMILGGIPFYLDLIKPGKSVVQTIDNLFFQKEASLNFEFDELYSSLFGDSEIHEKITKLLSKHHAGLTRDEILKVLKLSSGGSYTKVFNDLEHSHFLASYTPFGIKRKDKKYKLNDPFILFYFRYVIGNKNSNVWEKTYNTPTWKSWSGLAFENICINHVDQIKKVLEINGIISNTSFWHHKGTSVMPGAQIDLLIDRADRVINVCEIKYYEDAVPITKALTESVKNKITSFRYFTATRKTIFPILIAPMGVVASNQTFFTKVVDIDDLFKS